MSASWPAGKLRSFAPSLGLQLVSADKLAEVMLVTKGPGMHSLTYLAGFPELQVQGLPFKAYLADCCDLMMLMRSNTHHKRNIMAIPPAIHAMALDATLLLQSLL